MKKRKQNIEMKSNKSIELNNFFLKNKNKNI